MIPEQRLIETRLLRLMWQAAPAYCGNCGLELPDDTRTWRIHADLCTTARERPEHPLQLSTSPAAGKGTSGCSQAAALRDAP